MRRYQEQPSVWHVIVTCFAFLCLGQVTCIWLQIQADPKIPHTFWTVVELVAAGVVLALAAAFLFNELLRQRRLFKQWKKR